MTYLSWSSLYILLVVLSMLMFLIIYNIFFFYYQLFLCDLVGSRSKTDVAKPSAYFFHILLLHFSFRCLFHWVFSPSEYRIWLVFFWAFLGKKFILISISNNFNCYRLTTHMHALFEDLIMKFFHWQSWSPVDGSSFTICYALFF